MTVAGVPQSMTRARERQVLATLVSSRDAAVSADRLATDIWGTDAGHATVGLVHVAVSRLRSLLEPDRTRRGGDLIVNTPAGYLLHADAADVDVWRFEDLAHEALDPGRPPERIVAIGEEAALLWSTPYAGLDAPGPQRHAGRLRELHADLEVEHGRALLDMGRADAAVLHLSEISTDYPFREPLWCLLALAQYRGGRQADALETLRRLRGAMAAELGVDPAPATLEREQAILRQDPALQARASPVTTATSPDDGPRIVGRVHELEVAASLLADARTEGRAQFLLVAGEPGVGKSAYLGALEELAAQHGFEVVVGHNHEDDLAPVLWPWLEIVRPLLAGAPPELRETLEPMVSPDASAPARGGRPLRTYDAVLDLLAGRARARPLLVVIEDLHCADTATLQLIRHVAHARLRVPIVVALSRRTTTPLAAPLLDCLAELSAAHVVRVRLDGLTTAAVGELLTSVAGGHTQALDAFVTELTGGNPLFVLQYAGLLATHPHVEDFDPTTVGVPEGIMDVLRQRMHHLPQTAIPVIVSASVLGLTIEPEVVAALVGAPVDDVLAALDTAVAAGLAVEQGSRYAFVHALARASAYGELSAARRVRLHDRAGRIIEDQFGDGADTAAAIAQHAWAASTLSPAHRERAAHWRARAAGLAAARHATKEALDLWRDVLASVPTDSEAAARAHGGAAVALMQLTRLDEAASEIEAGVAIARDLGSWDLVAELVSTLAAVGPWGWPIHGRSRAAFMGALQEAVPVVSERSRALLLAVLEVELYHAATRRRRGEHAPLALALARRQDDDDLLRRVILFLLVGTTGIWSAQQRLALVDELFALEPTDDLLVGALLSRAVVEWENQRPDAADAAMERCAAEAGRLGIGAVELVMTWWHAARARDRDAPDADALLEAAMDLHRQSGAIGIEDVVWLAAARHAAGAHALARLRAAPPPRVQTARLLVAHVLLEAGEEAAARTVAEEVDWSEGPYAGNLENLCFRLVVLAGIGAPEEIRRAIEALEPHRGRTVTLGAWADHCGVTDHFLAVGYAAVGDPRAAATAADAQQANEALGCAPWTRRSAALLASLAPEPTLGPREAASRGQAGSQHGRAP
ncbi:hypothetical protein ASG73_00500 [Janibacter sp. Soil728]|nr:hypothetical protein ASG73_00500 [Janibacter sp. Soil728]